MGIPAFGPDGRLPPGEHLATWDDLEKRLRFSTRRRDLVRGLLRGLLDLRGAGCRRVFVDGSFATATRNPNDIDVAWDPTGVDPALLDPTFFQFDNRRAAQKAKWGCEFFPSIAAAAPGGITYVEFFKSVHDPPEKGILVVELGSLP